MAVQTSLPALLDTLTQSLTSAVDATPKIAGLINQQQQPTPNGVSLLDVKNELLLSYLQNLVFLILLKIRNARDGSSNNNNNSNDGEEEEQKHNGDGSSLPDEVVKKLVELRLFLDKGVRPLEEKLRFQLDKMLRAADDADRRKEQLEMQKQQGHGKKSNGGGDDDSEGDSDDDDSDEDDGGDSLAPKPGPASARQFAPGVRGFEKPTGSAAVGMAAAAAAEDKSGIYRPPKIAPTVMPTTERRESSRGDRRPLKSATMDEYVAEELSSAPMAMPSVGTTIVSGGRKIKTAGEKAEEDRRRDYEETNFVRLPKESKKDRAKRNKIEGRSSRTQFGGEDWRELGEGVDRISRLTGRGKGGSGSGGSTRALLEKSRKRGRDTADSARGSGLNDGTREIGDRFNKRVKVMEGGRRDRGGNKR